MAASSTTNLGQEEYHNVRVQVGNGDKAFFWLDKWNGIRTLKEDFQMIFEFATSI